MVLTGVLIALMMLMMGLAIFLICLEIQYIRRKKVKVTFDYIVILVMLTFLAGYISVMIIRYLCT